MIIFKKTYDIPSQAHHIIPLRIRTILDFRIFFLNFFRLFITTTVLNGNYEEYWGAISM